MVQPWRAQLEAASRSNKKIYLCAVATPLQSAMKNSELACPYATVTARLCPSGAAANLLAKVVSLLVPFAPGLCRLLQERRRIERIRRSPAAPASTVVPSSAVVSKKMIRRADLSHLTPKSNDNVLVRCLDDSVSSYSSREFTKLLQY